MKTMSNFALGVTTNMLRTSGCKHYNIALMTATIQVMCFLLRQRNNVNKTKTYLRLPSLNHMTKWSYYALIYLVISWWIYLMYFSLSPKLFLWYRGNCRLASLPPKRHWEYGLHSLVSNHKKTQQIAIHVYISWTIHYSFPWPPLGKDDHQTV